jgi:protein phosphatase
MEILVAGLSDVGRQREKNEDSFVLLPEHGVFVVADGIGGHHSGDVASSMVASCVSAYLGNGGLQEHREGERLVAALVEANAAIFAYAGDFRAHHGMGTTVVAAAFAKDGSDVLIAHAGDSRCYRLRDGSLAQLTRDHSLIEDALSEDPDMSALEIASLPKNVITRAIGVDATVEIAVRKDEARPGDVYLLCSDGLHGLVAEHELCETLTRSAAPAETCERLVRRANERGGPDNITAVVVRVEVA